MSRVLLFNKPYGVICQFSRDGLHPTLADFISVPDFYPAGRLDTDSEGLLLLTDDGKLQHQITDPTHKLPKTYWVQVEGVPDEAALERLRSGVHLKDGLTLPAQASTMKEPAGLVATRSSGSFPQSNSHLLVAARHSRRQEPPDSKNDGGSRLSNFAIDTLLDRRLVGGWYRPRPMVQCKHIAIFNNNGQRPSVVICCPCIANSLPDYPPYCLLTGNLSLAWLLR